MLGRVSIFTQTAFDRSPPSIAHVPEVSSRLINGSNMIGIKHFILILCTCMLTKSGHRKEEAILSHVTSDPCSSAKGARYESMISRRSRSGADRK
jgi:hypothetical protein